MINIYQLKNTRIPYYFQPMFSPLSKEDFKSSTYRDCLLDPKKAKEAHIDECELYYIGTFDDVTGKIVIFDEKDFLMDIRSECFKNE